MTPAIGDRIFPGTSSAESQGRKSAQIKFPIHFAEYPCQFRDAGFGKKVIKDASCDDEMACVIVM
jgi:hypothetical protein